VRDRGGESFSDEPMNHVTAPEEPESGNGQRHSRRRTRVLFTIPCYWPAVAYGGPVRKSRDMARALAERGVEVTVLTSNLLDLRRRLSSRTVERRVDGVEVVHLHAPLRYRWSPVCPGAITWSRTHISAFDVVHVFGYRDSIGITAAAVARSRGVPLVFEPVGMYQPSSRSLFLKRAFDRLLGRRLGKWADVVVATSSLERGELVSAGISPDRITVRPNGVWTDELRSLPQRGALRARLGVPLEAPVALFLGRISRQKGLPFLAEGVSRVPGAHLVVAGADDGDGGREDLERAATRLGILSRVHQVGVLEGIDKLQALADADALALVSRGESFGNAAAEAVAAGLPVLVTDRCGVAEFVGPAAVVASYDRHSVVDGLERVLLDPAIRKSLRREGISLASRLDWRAVADRQLEVYLDAVARTREGQ
jgi:glycosyltransferase involved in cell wall biosynthesis